MCTSSNGVERRNDAHWHFATTCAATPVARDYEELKRTIAAQVTGPMLSHVNSTGSEVGFVEHVVTFAIAKGYPIDLSDR
jgi:hypothetical protein